MSKTLIVNNQPFQYPQDGEDPGWGEGASDWATAVTDALSSIVNPNDIPTTEFSIANNTIAPQNVVGLVFNTSTVRSATIQYFIYRVTNTNTSGFAETGTMNIIYDTNASSGQKWLVSQSTSGNSGVVLDITDAGQFTYTSSNITGTGYSGTMKFKAQTISST